MRRGEERRRERLNGGHKGIKGQLGFTYSTKCGGEKEEDFHENEQSLQNNVWNQTSQMLFRMATWV